MKQPSYDFTKLLNVEGILGQSKSYDILKNIYNLRVNSTPAIYR